MWHDMNPIGLAKQVLKFLYGSLFGIIIIGMGLKLRCVTDTNLIRVTYHCISHSFHFNNLLKQLYVSNKTEQFSYKGRCCACGHTYICQGTLKEELAWSTDKQFLINSNIMLFKTVILLRN